MVRINLAPGDRGGGRRRTPRLRSLPGLPRVRSLPGSPSMAAGGMAVVLLLALVFLYYTERRGVEQAQAAIVDAQADSVRLHSSIERVRALERTQERLAARVALLDDVVTGRLYWLQMMETLSQTVPDYTWLERVDQEDLEPDQVRIAGATFAAAAVTEYMRDLEISPLLKDITLIGVTRSQRDSLAVQGFTLVGTYENYDAVVVVPADSAGTNGTKGGS